MIERDAKPIGHRTPYKRVDLGRRRPQHPAVITQEDYQNGVIPDEALYEYDWNAKHWVLK